MSLLPAAAQVAELTPQTAASSPDAIKQREQELKRPAPSKKAQPNCSRSSRPISRASVRTAASSTRSSSISPPRFERVETRIGDAEARLRPLDTREQQIRSSLDSRRAEIVEVLAALQRAGRRTPPALLVRPEDALQSLRTAILLGSVVPELRARAEKLTSDLTELIVLRKAIGAERDHLATDRDKLGDDQTRLAALVDERQRKQSAIEKDMEAEGARAIALSKQVDSLQGLIGKMEQDLKSAAKAAAAANLQGAPATLDGKPNLGALKNPARLSPAIAFASAKGLFALPVNGVKIREFGGSDGSGGAEKGISLATRAGAQVTTPCDGWVVYAGPFRSYGQLLILNAGGGYHVLIAGMERISVNIGQFVLTGEPVATMGTDVPGCFDTCDQREPARALYRVP